MAWPTLTPERAKEFEQALNEATVLLTKVAGSVTVYPGGGAPAHLCREAASAAADARIRVRDLLARDEA